MANTLLKQLAELNEKADDDRAFRIASHLAEVAEADPSALVMKTVTLEELERIHQLAWGEQGVLTESDDELFAKFPELLE